MKKKKIIIFGLIFIALLSILVIFFLVNRNKQPKILPDEAVKNALNEIEEVETDETKEKIEMVNKLKEENSDTYGYIIIDGTAINYPVMHTKGEDYYERKDFYHNYSIAGSIFVNKNNNVSPRDKNLIIYGHNMQDGSMFNTLHFYENEEFLNNHKIITLITDDYEQYEVISVFKSKIYNTSDNVFKFYKHFNFNTEEEFNYYFDNIEGLSSYSNLDNVSINDTFITLVTCSYHTDNGRIGVIAKKL